VPDLKDELRQLADEAARQARPLPVADVIQEGDRRHRRTITPRRRESAGASGRRWPGWVAPLAAAAAVIAVITVAVTVSGVIHGRGPAGHRPAATLYVGYTIFGPVAARNPPPARSAARFGLVPGRPASLSMTAAIVPIDTATNRAGKPIPIKGNMGDIAVTPDGKTAYVASGDLLGEQVGTVTPISTATNTPGRPIRIRGGAGIVAITPDGKTAYVGGWDKITPISTATNTPGRPILIYGAAEDIAITPDGKTAYVRTDAAKSGIIPIDTATNRAGKPIRVCRARPGTNPLGDFPRLIAVTPDGKTLYVSCMDGTLVPISTATKTPGRPIPNSGGITIAFSPDGKTAYVGGWGTVIPVSTATNTAGKPIRIGVPVVEVMAITPDGKTLYVTNYEGRPGDRIVPIRTATNRPGPPIHVGSPAEALAVTPDGKTLYAVTGDTVVPISTATNRAGKPLDILRGSGPGGLSIAITP
jgi:DNA-binding beta-propeller fold protein YncE